MHLLQVFQAALKTPLAVPERVAKVVAAASAANFSASEVASAAAAAAARAVSTTVPLQGLGRSVESLGHLGAEAQAAVIAAAGAELLNNEALGASIYLISLHFTSFNLI